MSKVVAVFGAGTGLGVSVARRFGREGFAVALIARRSDRLAGLVDELSAQGIDSAAFAADLSDPAGISDLITQVIARFGRIDVVEYGPVGSELSFTAAAELSALIVEPLARLFLLSPIEVVRAVLPDMRERGEGAILFTHGYSAAKPMAYFSGIGPVMAAARNYVYSLHEELAFSGVYAGTLTVGASIDRSEMSELAASSDERSAAATMTLPTVDPDELADIYWDMCVHRDVVEKVYPPTLPL